MTAADSSAAVKLTWPRMNGREDINPHVATELGSETAQRYLPC